MQGRIDRSQLTPAFSKQLPDGDLKGTASALAGLGGLQAIVFKGETGSGKAQVYRYLLRFAQTNVMATFVVTVSNRISGFDLSG